jgi:hypothetical protein
MANLWVSDVLIDVPPLLRKLPSRTSRNLHGTLLPRLQDLARRRPYLAHWRLLFCASTTAEEVVAVVETPYSGLPGVKDPTTHARYPEPLTFRGLARCTP